MFFGTATGHRCAAPTLFTPTKAKGSEHLPMRADTSDLGPGSYTEALAGRWPFLEASSDRGVAGAGKDTDAAAAELAAPAFGATGDRWRSWKQYGAHPD